MKDEEIKKELEKFRDPYGFWLEEHEKWRGDESPKKQQDRFLSEYILQIPDGTVNDPDMISRFARYASRGDFDLIYCDEDIIRDGKRTDPYFKPDYSPDTEESFDYIGGLRAYGRSYLERAEEGNTALRGDRVCHIPEVLCHYLAERDMEYPKEKNGGADMFVDRFDESVSVIILSKDHPDLVRTCLESLTGSGLPDKTELILIDNGSREHNRDRYERIAEEFHVRYCYEPMEFNYSRLCNLGAQIAAGRYLLFLNDDIEVPEEASGFVMRLCRKAAGPDIGAVGIRLRYPETDRIQHCGITILKTGPSHKLCGYDDSVSYEHGINRHDINVAAVTGACLCIRADLFRETGGFDNNLPLAYNDVDLCLRLLERGYYNVCMNSMYLYHHESATRADDRTDLPAYERLKEYRAYFEDRHQQLLEEGDPFYSPNLTKTGLDYKVDVSFRWEKSGVERKPLKKVREAGKSRNILSHADSVVYRLNDAYGNEDFFEFTGWILKGKKRASGYGVGALAVCGDKRLVFSGERVYRKDVADAFPEEKDACMAGVCVRIARQEFEAMGMTGICEMYPVLIEKNGKIHKGEEGCQIRIE